MRGIYAVFIILLLLMTSAQCQQTANTWTISGFDLENSAKYNKALNTGLDLYYQSKFDEAVKAYDNAIRLDPNSTQTWQAWNGKGDALYGLGKYDEAVQAYDKAIQLWPDNAIPWAYKGDALKALGRTNESEAAYTTARDLGFFGSTWRPKTITLNGRPIEAQVANVTAIINSAIDLYNQGKYDEAAVTYEDAIRRSPNNVQTWQAWKGKGDALLALGRTDESDAAYATAKEMYSLINTTISTNAAPVNHILDHSMASGIDESTNSAITRTYNFTGDDSKVYSWVSLGNVGPGSVNWYWYSPDLNLYKTFSVEIPPNPNGGNWPSYNVWSDIDIADIPAEPYLSGNWQVKVYVLGSTYMTQLTESFTLENGHGDATISPIATAASILDHSMSGNVDESASRVITRDYKFFMGTDSSIYSWLSLENAGPGTFYWFWHSPNGTIFKTGPVVIPANPSGGYWPSYNIWGRIDASTLYGDTWEMELPSNEFYVDVTRNGYHILTEYFTIDE